MRLEGWMQAPDLRPSFETRASAHPQDEVLGTGAKILQALTCRKIGEGSGVLRRTPHSQSDASSSKTPLHKDISRPVSRVL